MVKKDLKLTIEEGLLVEMKEKIPNISKFLSDYATNHLRSNNRPELVIRQEIVSKEHQIMELEQEIGFLQAQLKNITGYSKDQQEKENFTWRKLWSEYRDTQQTHPTLMDPAVETLGETEETLLELLNYLDYAMERGDLGVNKWNYVKENFLNKVKAMQ